MNTINNVTHYLKINLATFMTN